MATVATNVAAEGFELRPGGTRPRALLTEIWRSRRLMGTLARKDFYVRYRRASLGMFWAIGLPLIQALVMAVVFSRVVGDRLDTNGSYAAFIVAGQVAWSFFSGVVNSASTAIVDGASLSNRIYFPRAVLPLTSVLTQIYGFVISAVLMVGLVLLFGADLGPQLLLLPVAMALAVLLGASIALLVSALHVYFRDMRYIVAAVMMPLFYLTPVLYPLEGDLIPDRLKDVIRLNPATGMVELFRAATVGADPGWGWMVAVTGVWIVCLLAGALYFHCRFNRVFSDLM